jgi:hypothetical protein
MHAMRFDSPVDDRVMGARRALLAWALLGLTASAVACSTAGDRALDPTDGAASIDAGAPDAGEIDAHVGDPCHGPGSCGDLECLDDPVFKDGYCSRVIAECAALPHDPQCPSGSDCINIVIRENGASKSEDICALLCDPSRPDRCDAHDAEGYACCSGGYCLPAALCL